MIYKFLSTKCLWFNKVLSPDFDGGPSNIDWTHPHFNQFLFESVTYWTHYSNMSYST